VFLANDFGAEVHFAPAHGHGRDSGLKAEIVTSNLDGVVENRRVRGEAGHSALVPWRARGSAVQFRGRIRSINTTKAGTRIGRTMKVSSMTPTASANPSSRSEVKLPAIISLTADVEHPPIEPSRLCYRVVAHGLGSVRGGGAALSEDVLNGA
jgi:hypothetical protein